MNNNIRNLSSILITIACTMAIIPLMAPGCGEGEGNGNVGYYSISIHGFEEADYIEMLKSADQEMQYNAICNLGERDYNRILVADSLKGTGQYDTALMVYQKIYSLMESKNQWVSSAAIRFINGFQYHRRAFVQSALNNDNPARNVQLEIIMDLALDSAKDQDLLNQKIRFLQQQPSWLLQNGRYLLIGKKDNFSLNQLTREYNTSAEEYKKLLILHVLTEHVTDSVFSFLANEWATTKNERIKDMIFSALPKANSHQLVLQWFNDHYYMSEKDMKEIVSHLLDQDSSNTYGKLIAMALEKGWKPSSVICEQDETELAGLPLLYTYLFLTKYRETDSGNFKLQQTVAGKTIEDALLRDPLLRSEWLNFEKRMLDSQKPALPAEAINRHRQLTVEYLRRTRLLLLQYKVDSSLYSSFEKDVNTHADVMYKEKIQ